MTVPYWVQDSIFYQIFPDRFADGDPTNNPPNVRPWGSAPTIDGFQGGDIRGIIKNFDYLLDLGVSALYLNPIFLSPSTHRYNTSDYYTIDPKLGIRGDFSALLEVAHTNNIRIILDGVFNHCGRGFFAFNDILENQDHSPYKDWFHIRRFPVNAYSPGPAEDYLAWWGFKSLPKFNTDNPAVRRYLLEVGRYWIEQGADGWRLDVPNEINDDSFWAEFRHAVKSVNRDAYLVGEIWTADPRWTSPNHFDGLMNYPLRDDLLRFLIGTLTAGQFVEKVENLLNIYPREHVYAMFLTLGTHDTERILTKLDGDIDKVKLAFLFMFSLPGTPSIYYGDEIGMRGGKDPECRGAFPWNHAQWNLDLREWISSLIYNRKKLTAMRRGDYRRIYTDDRRHCYAFARRLGDEKILIVMNASPTPRHMRVPVEELGWTDGTIVRSLLGRDEYIISGNSVVINLPAWGGVWVK
jgi:glycosidase